VLIDIQSLAFDLRRNTQTDRPPKKSADRCALRRGSTAGRPTSITTMRLIRLASMQWAELTGVSHRHLRRVESAAYSVAIYSMNAHPNSRSPFIRF
jgi:hypothetical protein